MSINFVLGGAGGGKTHYILEEVLKEASQNLNQTYFVIVPEQFTMQTQRELVKRSKNGGILNIEVQSFLRLAYRVFSETGTGKIPVLDDMGKTMILRKVLQEQKDKLQFFGQHIHKSGYITEIKSFLSEMKQYGLGTEQVDAMIEHAKNQPLLKRKLEDMKLICQAFDTYLEEKYITSEEILSVFSNVVADSKLIRNAVFYFDGFTGFTPIQYELIEQIISLSKKVVFTVTMDRRESIWEVGEPYKLFYMSKKELARIKQIALRQKQTIGEVIWVGEDRQNTRFQEADDLFHMEHHLLRYPSQPYQKVPTNLSIHELQTPENEVHFVLSQIIELRKEPGFEYRDIAIVTGDLEQYGLILKNAMQKASIPCFVDQKSAIILHPYVDMLLSVLDVILSDFQDFYVMKFAKNRLLNYSSDAVDKVENFLLATGIRGHKKWQQEWNCEYLYRRKGETVVQLVSEEMNRLRNNIWNELSEIFEAMSQGNQPLKNYISALDSFVKEHDFAAILTEASCWFDEQGDAEQAKEYEKIYELVESVLTHLEELMGEESVSLREFKELFTIGLEEARIGMIPHGIDQIMVGDLSRTRLAEVKYVFFVGMSDNNIPKGAKKGGVLSETERNFLSLDFELAPTSREQIYEEQFYFYLTLTKPSKHLYITYSLADLDGKNCRRAFIVERLCKLFPKLTICNEEHFKDIRHILRDDCGDTFLISGLQQGFVEKPEWRELYRQKLCDQERAQYIQKLIQAHFYVEPKSEITKKAARLLYDDILTSSITQLEKYAACPFSYFMQYGLRLEERQEHQVAFFDIGNIVHQALEKYTRKMLAQNKNWTDISPKERVELANTCLQQMVNEYKDGILQDTMRTKGMISRLQKMLHRTIWAITEQMSLGKFKTIDSELRFYLSDQAQHVVGQIDRLDAMETEEAIYLSVIDYKTGSKDINLSDFYYGLSMQLVVYLREAISLKEKKTKKMIIPAGMLYYNISDPLLNGKVSKADWKEKMMSELRMKGLVNEDDPILPSIDQRFLEQEKMKSLVAPFSSTKNGELDKKSKTLTSAQFQEIIDYTGTVIKQFGKEILEGNTRVYPYQKDDSGRTDACEYCNYHSICRFDVRTEGNQFHRIPTLSDDQVLQEIRKETTDEANMDERSTESD